MKFSEALCQKIYLKALEQNNDDKSQENEHSQRLGINILQLKLTPNLHQDNFILFQKKTVPNKCFWIGKIENFCLIRATKRSPF